MKQLIILTMAMVMTACTTASPEQFYRPAGASEQLTVSGNFNQLTFEHKVMVNGETVITGSLPYNYDDASFSGSYGETSVASDCHWKSKTELRCLVKMNGENAATLVF